MTGRRSRDVVLRDELTAGGRRVLTAHVDERGNLHIDGQDLGPGTAMVSSDGEYEWFQVIAAVDIPAVVALLDGQAGDDVLDLMATGWVGARSYELERRLRESTIPIERSIWSG